MLKVQLEGIKVKLHLFHNFAIGHPCLRIYYKFSIKGLQLASHWKYEGIQNMGIHSPYCPLSQK